MIHEVHLDETVYDPSKKSKILMSSKVVFAKTC